jgi:hypothetical protein
MCPSFLLASFILYLIVQVHGGVLCGWLADDPCDADDDYPHFDNPWTNVSLFLGENPYVDFGQVGIGKASL